MNTAMNTHISAAINTAHITATDSFALQELHTLFGALVPPYSQDDIRRFNLLYQQIYSQLNRTEKVQAEELVDALIAGVEKEEWSAKIYGVV